MLIAYGFMLIAYVSGNDEYWLKYSLAGWILAL